MLDITSQEMLLVSNEALIRQDSKSTFERKDQDSIDLEAGLTTCPDCQAELTKFYEWDVVRYRCENCGVNISNTSAIFEDPLQEEHEIANAADPGIDNNKRW